MRIFDRPSRLVLPPNIGRVGEARVEHEICVGGTTALSCWREARIRVAESNASSPYDPNPRPLLVRMLFGGTVDLDLSALPVKTDITRLPKNRLLGGCRLAIRSALTCLAAPGLLRCL